MKLIKTLRINLLTVSGAKAGNTNIGRKNDTKQKVSQPGKAFSILLFLSLLSFPLSISTCFAGNEKEDKIGVLVIAHGSPSENWCRPVMEAVEAINLGYPTEIGFLEFVEELEDYSFIPEAVEQLDEHGVTKIIAVPLFVSSSSGHIQEIEYVLGLREVWPGGEEEPLEQIDTPAQIVLTSAMDDHSFIAQILADRAALLSEDPINETVVIVSHGTPNEACFEGWVSSSQSLAEQVKLKLRYFTRDLDIEDVKYAFIHLNEALHPALSVKAVVGNVAETSNPIVIPLMTSEGYFTKRYIPELLQDLIYAYDGKALAPHPGLEKWIEITVSKEIHDLNIQIQDNEEILNISIEDVGEYHGHICPCTAVAFRAAQLALSKMDLVRGDIKILSAHPSDGHEMTFEYILGSNEDLTIELPEGTDAANLGKNNYVYTFIKKSTGESMEIRVKEEIFSWGFFELRKKIKAKTATEKEIKAFKSAKKELKEKLLYLPVDDLFTWEKKVKIAELQETKIEEAIDDASEWIKYEGVEGVGQGEKDGKDCIVVLDSCVSPKLSGSIPSFFMGFPVIIYETGIIKALLI